jgi:hypothetical protein
MFVSGSERSADQDQRELPSGDAPTRKTRLSEKIDTRNARKRATRRGNRPTETVSSYGLDSFSVQGPGRRLEHGTHHHKSQEGSSPW